MSNFTPLRAADLGYEWNPSIPDGRAWTRDGDGTIALSHKAPTQVQLHSGQWVGGGAFVTTDSLAFKLLGIEAPDFGDRPWQECILVKGQESPELPPCPPGDGWVEWSGGECPVRGRVTLQFRDGSLRESANAKGWSWRHGSRDSDIVRYLVHPTKYRPYNDDEMKLLVRDGVYLEQKNGMCGAIAISWVRTSSGGPLAVRIGHGGLWIAESLLEEFVRRDGSPCGVEVQQ